MNAMWEVNLNKLDSEQLKDQNLIDLINLLTRTESHRLTPHDALKHCWLTSSSDESEENSD